MSALIVAAAWGTWHVQYSSDGLAFYAVFVVAAMAMSVILAELTRGAVAVAVAVVFHWLLNLAILLLFNFANGNLADITALAAGSAVAAIAVRGYARHRSRLAPAG